MKRTNRQQGFALITVLIMLVVFMALVTAYFTLTGIELSTTASSADSTTGFYASEGGLNMRGEAIRQTFLNYNRPKGSTVDRDAACQNPSDFEKPISDNFACREDAIGGRKVITYVTEHEANNSDSDNDRMIRIPDSETFGGLNAIQYRYDVHSEARNPRDNSLEARTVMTFRSRLVPVFQFAAFYNKDLEILPGADMTLNGRVHVNGDLYTNASDTLHITGKTTMGKRDNGSGGNFYRRRKNNSSCGGTVRVGDVDPTTNPDPAVDCHGAGYIAQSVLDNWNGQIETGLDTLTVPEVDAFNVGGQYWDQADLRIALDAQTNAVIIPRRNIVANQIQTDVAATATLQTCLDSNSPQPWNGGIALPASGAVDVSVLPSFFDRRENNNKLMLEIDVQALLHCMSDNPLMWSNNPNNDIDETSQGGLVIYATVFDNSANINGSPINNYGVRVRNGAQLQSNDSSHSDIQGLTFVTDQAMFVQGDYNRDGDDWRPASFLADSLNILSNAWDDDTDSNRGLGNRVAEDTEVNAAFLAGTDSTGNREGTGGQGGDYNGGLENYPRLHERWSGRTLTYKGSFVSFDKPQHVNGRWGQGNVYNAPRRNWSYDERFNNAEQLPPMAPRFVYLQQERFVRDFER